MRVIKNTLKKKLIVAEDELTVEPALKQFEQTPETTDDDTTSDVFDTQDVDDMSDAEVMNYAFINIPKNIDNNKRQQLLRRVNDIANQQQTQSGVQHGNFVSGVNAYTRDYKEKGNGLQETE